MDFSSPPTYSLDHFEGPIELLLRLVQSHEVALDGLSLSELTKQCLAKLAAHECNLDGGAQFIATTATLLYLKSCRLLPVQRGEQEPSHDSEDPNLSALLSLIDYCRFKHAAQQLSQREQQQEAFYPRGAPPPEGMAALLGIEHLALSDLTDLFSSIVNKAAAPRELVEEELFKICDKISLLHEKLSGGVRLPFSELFTENMPRLELIVVFLAILELMKCGEVCVIRDIASGEVALINSLDSV